MSTLLDISHIDMVFPTDKGDFTALKDVSLKIDKGEFVSLIGHSGCGKSTVLNVVAGLYQASKGGVVLNGKEVNEPGPERAVVFQNHSLLPWLSAYHEFDADEGSADYGDELDISFAKSFGKHYSAGVKYAAYSAGDASTGKVDTDKVWLWLGAKF